MGDMEEGGGVKNLKKEVTYFVNGPIVLEQHWFEQWPRYDTYFALEFGKSTLFFFLTTSSKINKYYRLVKHNLIKIPKRMVRNFFY